jgi:hypothetical protein
MRLLLGLAIAAVGYFVTIAICLDYIWMPRAPLR